MKTRNVKVTKQKGFKKPYLRGGKKWVEALESGKYRRETGALHEGRGYCCLGVLCRVQGRLKKTQDGTFVDVGEGHSSTLSDTNPVYNALGELGDFPRGVKVTIGDRFYDSLADLNDSDRVGFKTIAKVIRSIWRIG